MNDLMSILLVLCLKDECRRVTIPFNGTQQQCLMFWQLPVMAFMQANPGYTIKSAACVTPGIDV